MNSKKLLVSLLLIFSISAFGAEYENTFLTENIQEHLPEFLAMEITKDFKDSIVEYNQNRKNPNFFITLIKDEKLAKKFLESTKNQTLPEILQKKDSATYYVQIGTNRLEFHSTIFFTKKYYLNGVKKELKQDPFVTSNSALQTNIYSLLSTVIAKANANADEEEGFNAAYKNVDTTKVLMASLIALDSSFKSRSFTDKIPFAADVADTNIKNLVSKIALYQGKCDAALELQGPMLQKSRTKSDDYNNLSSLDQVNMMRSLQKTMDPDYQLILRIMKTIGDQAGNYQIDSKLVDDFKIDKKALTCEKMLKPLVSESKTKTNPFAAYLDGGNSGNAAFRVHPCTKITNLKLCLAKFSSQGSEINNFIGKRGRDAKDAGVTPVSPSIFTESIGK